MEKISRGHRILSVDTVRLCAIVAVVAVHTTPFVDGKQPVGSQLDLALVLNQLTRFAVPYFFLIAGYFWSAKIAGAASVRGPTLAMARRICILFGAWSLIYLLPFNLSEVMRIGAVDTTYANIQLALRHPLLSLFQGTKGHLWFLMSLLFCLAISAALVERKAVRTLVALSALLYVIGLLGKAYADTPLGFRVVFNFRNGPFFGLIFFVTGTLLHRLKPRPAWFPWGLAILGLGVVLHSAEIVALHHYWGTSLAQDFVVGTWLVGLGVGLVALSDSAWLKLPRISFVGPLVLGIYAVHYVFVDLLKPLDRMWTGVTAWEMAYPIAVFALSLLTAYGMSRVRLLRPLVV